jgi:hypothetical protein
MNTTTIHTHSPSPFLYFFIFIGITVTLIYFFTTTSEVTISSSTTHENWESLDLAIEDFLLRSETPPLTLTTEQLEDITV